MSSFFFFFSSWSVFICSFAFCVYCKAAICPLHKAARVCAQYFHLLCWCLECILFTTISFFQFWHVTSSCFGGHHHLSGLFWTTSFSKWSSEVSQLTQLLHARYAPSSQLRVPKDVVCVFALWVSSMLLPFLSAMMKEWNKTTCRIWSDSVCFFWWPL